MMMTVSFNQAATLLLQDADTFAPMLGETVSVETPKQSSQPYSITRITEDHCVIESLKQDIRSF